jgi:hypothetical protein
MDDARGIVHPVRPRGQIRQIWGNSVIASLGVDVGDDLVGAAQVSNGVLQFFDEDGKG